MITKNPTLSQLAADVERSLNPTDLRLDSGLIKPINQEEFYSNSLSTLVKDIPNKFVPADMEKCQTIFLTGATGFLGAYVLRDLLSYGSNVIVHVRAKSIEEAEKRVRQTCLAYGIWNDSWSSHLQFVIGDLEKENLGMSSEALQKIQNEADAIIHNGAVVHWIKPFSSLKAANVLSTLTAIKLCASGKPKGLVFISSTSALDNDHYIQVSNKSISNGGNGVSESDDMEGSRQGLTTGYGQTKWVSEQLLFEARRRGLTCAVIRAGYILGDPKSGSKFDNNFDIRQV